MFAGIEKPTDGSTAARPTVPPAPEAVIAAAFTAVVGITAENKKRCCER
jgi:hypothetical protein